MGIIYGFSSRQDGDMRRKVNRSRFLKSLGVDEAVSVRAEQVHREEIARVDSGHAGRIIPEADGLITTVGGIFLAVLAADCIPALFYDPKRMVVATAHLGWRGLAAELAAKMVRSFTDLGSHLLDLEVVLGPSVCPKHYEVGSKVISRFAEGGEAVFISEKGKTFLNLRVTARNQLLRAGACEDNIVLDPRCTFEDRDLYSWRREQPNLSGLFAGFIGIV